MAESNPEAGVVSRQALSQALRVDQKQLIRDRIWHHIDADPSVRRAPGAQGRIPNFVGAEAAARGLVALSEWHAARVVKSNPDSPQLSVRSAAIDAGKLLYMAVPRLTLDAPFLALSLAQLTVPAEKAASIEGAHQHGILTRLEDVQPVDFIVCGSVAVNARGVRIGKGGGFADLELALLAELGLVGEQTLIATTVHDDQVLDEELPETNHDFRVDVISTPTRVIRCARATRPAGIIWEDLAPEKIAAIPLLAERRPVSVTR